MITIKKIPDGCIYNDTAQIHYLMGKRDLFFVASNQDTVLTMDRNFKLQNISYPHHIPQYFIDKNKISILQPGLFKQYVTAYHNVDQDYIIIENDNKEIRYYSCRVVKYDNQYFYVTCSLKSLINDYTDITMGDINAMRVRDNYGAYVEINKKNCLIIKVLRPNLDSPVLYNRDADPNKKFGRLVIIKYPNEDNSINECNGVKVISFMDDSYKEPTGKCDSNGDMIYKTIYKFRYMIREIDTELINKYVEEIPLRINDIESMNKTKQKLLKPKKEKKKE